MLESVLVRSVGCLTRLWRFRLSNVAREARISIGVCSATMHDVEPAAASEFKTIALRPLDDIIAELGIEKLDFVKVAIDGREPAFIEGARRTLATFRSVSANIWCISQN